MKKSTKYPEPIAHIGWDFWRVTLAWKQRFTAEMVRRGHGWYAEARGQLIQHIGGNGIAQLELAERARMSKQAIQQHLDDLAADGIVERAADPADARKKWVRFTSKGFVAMAAAGEIKKEIEDDYSRLIGVAAMDSLKRSIGIILREESRDPERKQG